MGYIMIAFGGSCGSLTRFWLGKQIKSKTWFPLATFIINITGAFLLGIVSSSNISHNLMLLLADGFLGAYTTFSTFMFEGFTLFKGSKLKNALIYIFSTVIIGIIGFYMGSII
ncbi:fluoride efflux transporter CrcB [Clostridium sp. 19966]|uniref:fluoride efflux transporter CrcB n=1 Tax=Clostridium sp. 19966 TaxID=2768166 RepID=UPI0028DE9FB6|nr:fluoride efflux transporter CrcB [Clostridium sp. 19966]MDT8716201.1 fluoride efflux transporter CrcB [Clostridium sp. 19966]